MTHRSQYLPGSSKEGGKVGLTVKRCDLDALDNKVLVLVNDDPLESGHVSTSSRLAELNHVRPRSCDLVQRVLRL